MEKLMVPIIEAADAHGMPTAGQYHLRAVFHAYPAFIISLWVFIRKLPLVLPSFLVQNFFALASCITTFQFNKLAFKLPK